MNWKSLLGAFCFLGALVLSGCGGQTSVQVEKAEIKSIPLTIEINSKAEALHMIPVVPAVSGKIISEIPPAGTKVKQGDLLFQIDSSLYEEQAAALRAQIAASGANSSTSSSSAVDDSMEASLLRQGIITRAEYEKIQARKGFHGVPQAGPGNTGLTESLAALERTIADCMVRAPAGGVVSQNYSGDTKTAAAGRPVLMIQQETPVIFSLALPTKLNEFIEKIKD